MVVWLALLSLLMLATALGGVWHYHAGSSDTNCSICHFNHQPMERPLASHREPALGIVGLQQDSPEPRLVPNPEPSRLPARAPPSA
jgi:hypothetical protein